MPRTEERVASRANGRLKQLRAAVAGNTRLSDHLVAIEGEHLLEEAVRSGVALHSVFVAGERSVPGWIGDSTALVRVSEDLFRSAVETHTPRGIAALVEAPEWEPDAVLRSGNSQWQTLVLVLAGVQDPGNVGTLLRAGEAFGATGILLSPDSAGVWSGKAMRSSAGSVFRLPSVRVSGAAEVRRILAGVRILAAVGSRHAAPADSSSTAVRPIGEEDLTQPVALMIGNEGAGLGTEWMGIADGAVTIPCSGPVESLNAAIAAAVMMYEVQAQRLSARRGGQFCEPVR